MNDDFLHATLGRTGRRVFRLGLSGSRFPGESTLRLGIEAGINYLFWYWWDRHMTRVLREVLPANREKYLVATGVGNRQWMVRHGLESCLRKLRTDYIDVFHLFWVSAGALTEPMRDLLQRYKDQGKIRHIAISTHARPYAGQLIREGKLDVIMMRYNAAHRGAEQDIFPHLPCSDPGVVSYTATRWGKLLRRPKGWPAAERIATAGDCCRFVLSHPNVDVCLTAPRRQRELEENLAAVARGPLPEEELAFLRRFGDAVHAQASFLL